MLYIQTVSLFTLLSLIASYSYLCIWVNRCSIMSQVIIYLKVLKCVSGSLKCTRPSSFERYKEIYSYKNLSCNLSSCYMRC